MEAQIAAATHGHNKGREDGTFVTPPQKTRKASDDEAGGTLGGAG